MYISKRFGGSWWKMAQGRMFQSAIVFGKNENLKMSLFAFFFYFWNSTRNSNWRLPLVLLSECGINDFQLSICEQCDPAAVWSRDSGGSRLWAKEGAGSILFFYFLFYFLEGGGPLDSSPRSTTTQELRERGDFGMYKLGEFVLYKSIIILESLGYSKQTWPNIASSL